MLTVLTHCIFFFFNAKALTAIYTLSLHDALPISAGPTDHAAAAPRAASNRGTRPRAGAAIGTTSRRVEDRKSTRLNSSHVEISYAVFCLKKKKKNSHEAHRRHKYDEEKNTRHTDG